MVPGLGADEVNEREEFVVDGSWKSQDTSQAPLFMMVYLRLLAVLALCCCGHSLRTAHRCSRPRLSLATDVELTEQRQLFNERKARSEAAANPQSTWSTRPTRAVLDGLFQAGWQPRLEPEPLPVIELDGSLEPEALAR